MLSDFYKTRAWENFRKTVISQRTDDNGFIMCARCGKPILKPYDLIAHHITELTEINYQDTTISLNPDNIELVHHRCHNLIHAKSGMKARKVFIVYGAPLSGKSTYVRDVMNEGDLIVDIDNIWECVSGQPRYVKPARLKAVVFGIRDNLYDMVKYRRGNWNTAYIIAGLPLESERERLSRDLGAELVFIDTPKHICLDRLYASDDRGEEWLSFITDWFDTYHPPTS